MVKSVLTGESTPEAAASMAAAEIQRISEKWDRN
jgi:hypothetical protein